jgi:hypothetical protein
MFPDSAQCLSFRPVKHPGIRSELQLADSLHTMKRIHTTPRQRQATRGQHISLPILWAQLQEGRRTWMQNLL